MINLIKNTILVTALLAFAPVAQAATVNWDFTSNSSVSASGVLTVDANDQVLSLTGDVGGQAITFYTNPNFPGTSTLHGVPNTGGADFIYDDYFNPATNAVSVYGILFSVGTGANMLYYDLSVDGGSPSSLADLFSITSNGSYVFNEGTLSSTAVPLPSGIVLMLTGLLAIGFFAYREKLKRNIG